MPQIARGCAVLLPVVYAACFAAPAHAQNPGKKIFLEVAAPPCALCHTLKDAGATGEIGPNLDELKPDMQKVLTAVRRGVGNMPPYEESLTPAQITAVARYVAGVVGR